MEHLLFIDRRSNTFQKRMFLSEENFNHTMHVINCINKEKRNSDLVRGYLEEVESFEAEGYEEDQALFDKHIIEYNKNQTAPNKVLAFHIK